MSMWKKLCAVAAALAAAAALALPCAAAPDCAADCAILMDADSGAVLYEKQPDKRCLIASTTKIMTAIVVLEHCSPDEELVIPPEAVNIEGSSIYLKGGEVLTVRELLYGMMLHSGNDAAVALALACSGSVEEFVVLMNLKAQALGMENSSFENPNGLDGEKHYSTARDLAVLTAYALENPAFRQIVSTKRIQCGTRTFINHNKLLWSVDGAIGVKTGFTKAAGRILVSAAERSGRRLVAVTINDGSDWQDHQTLYDYGFARYHERELIELRAPVAEIPLMDGTRVALLAGDSVRHSVAENERVTVRLLYPRQAFSAGIPGTFAGSAAVYLGKRRIATIRLLWGKTEEFYAATTSKAHIRPRACLPPCSRTADCGRSGHGQRLGCRAGAVR